jgi:hypothetical protein
MKFRWWYGLAANSVLAALVIAAGAVWFQCSVPRLSITDGDSGVPYGTWALKEGDTFAIEFVHSVHNSPVRETFMVKGTEICPLETRFSSFGAGMQSELEEGQRLSRDGEFLLITGFNKSYQELNYIIGTISDHLLYIHNKKISLRARCGQNAHIRIWIKKGIL